MLSSTLMKFICGAELGDVTNTAKDRNYNGTCRSEAWREDKRMEFCLEKCTLICLSPSVLDVIFVRSKKQSLSQ